MSMQLFLALSVIVHVIAVAVWDLFVVMRGHSHETVSRVISVWANEHPMLPLVVGIVVGHLFWQNCPDSLKAKKNNDSDLVVRRQVK